jgi:two-component sensor histidine kinase
MSTRWPTASAALAAALTHPPDLVLTDVMMPGLDGFELLKACARNPETAFVPVILLSARAGEESRVEGMEAGADDYLTKPFSARELLARVKAHLELTKARREVEAMRRLAEERLQAALHAEALQEAHDQVAKLAEERSIELKEKEVLLKEIHHRVKNNLQVISSLVSMQANTLTDERIREELDDVSNRIRSMALVHEKLYQANNLAYVDFAEYTTSMLGALWRSHGVLADKIRLNLAVVPVAFPIETAIPCGLILNELAINAIKHAFPQDGNGDREVTVGIHVDSVTNTFSLRVSDNGVGLPVGLDWRQSPSLGLRLVQILASQLRGKVETGTGPGAEFQVTFPLNVQS